MSNLPSFWGKHNEADIDLVQVNGGALVTAISQAPDEWEGRLEALGFSRRPKAWLRLGGMTQSEFHYLSPSIDLIGMRASNVLAMDDLEDSGEGVPAVLQNTILSLWQRQSGAVLVALSAEHGINYTRQQAWSFAEAAIDGEASPETETLIGLALTKLSLDGQFDQGVEAYAQSIGWEGLPNATPARDATVVLKAGSSVTWVDREGVPHAGRTAGRMKSDAQGLWIFENGPRWSAGYPVVAPTWIDRTQLQYEGHAPDWLESDLLPVSGKPGASSVPRQLDVPNLELSTAQREAIRSIIGMTDFFPSANWSQSAESLGLSGDVVSELQQVADAFDRVSELYYQRLPLRFGFTDDFQDLHVAIAVDVRGCPESIPSSPFGMAKDPYIPVKADGPIDLGSACKSLDKSLRVKAGILSSQADQLGEHIPGSQGPALRARHGQEPFWLQVAVVHGGELSPDDLYMLLAASLRSPDMIGSAMANTSVLRSSLAPQLSVSVRHESERGIDSCRVRVGRFEVGVVPVSEVLTNFQNARNTGWLEPAQQQSAKFYGVDVDGVGELLGPIAQVPGVNVIESFERLDHLSPDFQMPPRYLLADEDQALSAFAGLAKALTGNVTPESMVQLESAERLASRWHLKDRWSEALQKIKALPADDFGRLVEAALIKETKGKFSNYTEAFRDRIKARLFKTVAEHNGTPQGLIVFMSPRSVTPATVAADLAALTETRTSVLSKVSLQLKNTGRYVGKPHHVDLVSFVDSELCEAINMPFGEIAELGGRTKQAGEGKHQDTGVVSGLAIKDLRSMGVKDLQASVTVMSEAQRSKYLTKASLWPRKSMLEMRDAGVPLPVALSFDVFWRGLPSKPLTTHTSHSNAFIKLIGSMRDGADKLLQESAKSRSPERETYQAFSEAIGNMTIELFRDNPELCADYPHSKRRIRGTSLYWVGFSPFGNRKHDQAISQVTWDDVIKEKRLQSSAPRSRVARDEVVREGPDYRNGRDVDAEDFIKTFLYSGVEYGNWTNQKERAKHLNFAFDSMMDFSRVLGVEPAALSLGGRLGLCFGSRGKGGKSAALAHYDPANMAINLTRMRGDGSLAHEYFHAIANHYGRIATGINDDLAELVGYPLQRPGRVEKPQRIGSRLRDESLSAFHGLLTAIMRNPEKDSDPKDVSNYTQVSEMLRNAQTEDKSRSGSYWATPAEMFARGMETWFKATLAEQDQRNDYLVADRKAMGGLYPSEEQMGRIQHFASSWLESLKTEVREVEHPYLGSVNIPVLYTHLAADLPLTRQDLIETATDELERLFGAVKPALQVSDRFSYVGMYHAASNIISLHADKSDMGTFYHEAWHAAEAQLLCNEERRGLHALFGPGSEATAHVADLMRQKGFPESVVNDALADSREMTAYAFQLWTQGELVIADLPVQSFERTRLFVDGVVEVGALFTPLDAERLFAAFAAGEMADRIKRNPDNLADGAEWSDEDFLVWQADHHQPVGTQGPRFGP